MLHARSLPLSRFLSSAVIAAVLMAPAASHAVAIDPMASRVGADKSMLKADGIDNASVVVSVRNTNLGPVEGATVTLVSSRGSQDEIKEEYPVSDLTGHAYFRVSSLRDGTATFIAKIGDLTLERTATVTFSGGLSAPVHAGELIKIPDDSNAKTLSDTAVYYYAANGKRYVFPNEGTYFTWYKDFSKVKVIPIDQMSLIPIGGNVTYHPGTRMVKFQTDVKTYMVTRGGVLRWVKTEEVARDWFGSDWNRMIDDVSEAFYANYKFGAPVANALDLSLEIVRNDVQTIDADKGLK